MMLDCSLSAGSGIVSASVFFPDITSERCRNRLCLFQQPEQHVIIEHVTRGIHIFSVVHSLETIPPSSYTFLET